MGLGKQSRVSKSGYGEDWVEKTFKDYNFIHSLSRTRYLHYALKLPDLLVLMVRPNMPLLTHWKVIYHWMYTGLNYSPSQYMPIMKKKGELTVV